MQKSTVWLVRCILHYREYEDMLGLTDQVLYSTLQDLNYANKHQHYCELNIY